MRLINADDSDAVIIFDKDSQLCQVSAVRAYCEQIRQLLAKFPTIDARPIIHGHWLKGNYSSQLICSECGADLHVPAYIKAEYNYCPCCGADMTERVNEEGVYEV